MCVCDSNQHHTLHCLLCYVTGEVAGLERSVQIMRHSGESRCHGRARGTLKRYWVTHWLKIFIRWLFNNQFFKWYIYFIVFVLDVATFCYHHLSIYCTFAFCLFSLALIISLLHLPFCSPNSHLSPSISLHPPLSCRMRYCWVLHSSRSPASNDWFERHRVHGKTSIHKRRQGRRGGRRWRRRWGRSSRGRRGWISDGDGTKIKHKSCKYTFVNDKFVLKRTQK